MLTDEDDGADRPRSSHAADRVRGTMRRAQPSDTSSNAARGAELSLYGGTAVGSCGVSRSFGWSAGWRPSARAQIEGSGD